MFKIFEFGFSYWPKVIKKVYHFRIIYTPTSHEKG